MYTITHEDTSYEVRTKQDLADVPTTALVSTYNELAGKSIKKFSDRATAEERVAKLIIDVDAAPEDVPTGATTTGRKSTLPRNAKIKINANEVAAAGEKYDTPTNPKRPGTQAAAQWDKYREGITVDALHKVGVPLADIRWNLEKGFIALEEAGNAAE